MTKMRILLVVALAIGLAGMAYASDHDSMNLLVTPTGNISVNIYQTQYNYQSVALYNTTTINTSAITVENDGNAQSTWWDWANNSANWTLRGDGESVGDNQFKLASSTGGTQPDAGSTSYHVLPVQGDTNTVILAGAVASLGTHSLWIRLTMPNTVSGAGSGMQTILYGIYAIGD